jgi:hypothetical protein
MYLLLLPVALNFRCVTSTFSFVRVYNTTTRSILSKIYVKQRLNAVIFTDAPFEVGGRRRFPFSCLISTLATSMWH